VAEFISTDYSSLGISKYLQTTKHIFDKYSTPGERFCPIFVTDFSYALINSILKVFNNCQLSHYILWTFHVLIEYTDVPEIGDIMKTKIYICSVHFLKSLAIKVKKLEKTETVAKSFIFAFSLLQNSVTVNQFNLNLRHIFNVFCHSFLNESVCMSMNYLKAETSYRKLSHLNISKNKRYCFLTYFCFFF